MINTQLMKILCIMASKINIVLIALLFSLTSHAQDLSDLIFGQNNKSDYIGQYNYNGKRKNGFGIERYKNGAIYIGDFVEDKVTGRGMLISQTSGISNVKGAVVYVGAWRDGKKEGRGICYDASGNVTFKGKFVKDKPSETTTTDDSFQYFVIKDIGNTVYLGEMKGDAQDGFGLTLQESGEMILGSIKNNVRQGLSMIFYTPNIWEVGQWTDGTFTAFNNSQKANSDIESFRQLNKEAHKIARDYLFQAAGSFAQAGLTTATMVNEIKGGSSTDSEGDDGSVPSGKSQSYYQSMYDKWKAKAESTFQDRAKHKASANISGDRGTGKMASSDAKLLRQYQHRMKQIRLQAKKEGFNIVKSQYEDATY